MTTKTKAAAAKATVAQAIPASKPRRSRARASAPLESAPVSSPAPAPTTKLETLASLLQREEGATVEQLMAATGWQQHSVRGALAGAMRKRFGAKVVSEKVQGVRLYRAPIA